MFFTVKIISKVSNAMFPIAGIKNSNFSEVLINSNSESEFKFIIFQMFNIKY